MVTVSNATVIAPDGNENMEGVKRQVDLPANESVQSKLGNAH